MLAWAQLAEADTSVPRLVGSGSQRTEKLFDNAQTQTGHAMMLLKGMAMMAAASSVAAHVRTLHPRAYTPTRASQTERVPLLARVTHWHLTYPIDPALAEHLPQAPGREVSDALHSLPIASPGAIPQPPPSICCVGCASQSAPCTAPAPRHASPRHASPAASSHSAAPRNDTRGR